MKSINKNKLIELIKTETSNFTDFPTSEFKEPGDKYDFFPFSNSGSVQFGGKGYINYDKNTELYFKINGDKLEIINLDGDLLFDIPMDKAKLK